MSAQPGAEGRGRAAPPDERTGPAPYSVEEALPFVLMVLLVSVAATLVIAIGWRLGDLTSTSELPPPDLSTDGTVDLLGEGVDPYSPFGAHAHAINLTMGAGDVLVVDFASQGAPVQVLVQRPVHPVNFSSMPAVVLATGSGASGTLRFEAVEPGAVQVYIVNPAAVQPPPPGVPASGWHATARVTFSVRVDRAG